MTPDRFIRYEAVRDSGGRAAVLQFIYDVDRDKLAHTGNHTVIIRVVGERMTMGEAISTARKLTGD